MSRKCLPTPNEAPVDRPGVGRLSPLAGQRPDHGATDQRAHQGRSSHSFQRHRETGTAERRSQRMVVAPHHRRASPRLSRHRKGRQPADRDRHLPISLLTIKVPNRTITERGLDTSASAAYCGDSSRSAAAISAAALAAEGRAPTRSYQAATEGKPARRGPRRRRTKSTVMNMAMSATENSPQKYARSPSVSARPP